MLIRCLQERPGGTLHSFGPMTENRITRANTVHKFEPVAADGAHVCEVKDKKLIARLLSISEGFEPYGEKALIEARTHYGWISPEEREQVERAKANQIAEGLGPVVLEFLDDDDDDVQTIHKPIDHDDDAALDLGPVIDEQGNEDPMIADPLNNPPSNSASEKTIRRWILALPGITDADSHDQLIKFAEDNYGKDLSKIAQAKTMHRHIVVMVSQGRDD